MDLRVPVASETRFSHLGIWSALSFGRALGIHFMEEGLKKAGKRVRKTVRDSH